jgi:hypothetical protein
MSEINKVNNLDNINNTGTNPVKKSSESSGFSSFLGENKTLDSIFQEASKKYQVPVELLKAIGKAESNFNTKAISRCGAQGVMQLMPATAKSLGVTDSFDAEQNIMGGSKYIAGLLKKYDGNTKLALAAYNAGSGNVAKYNGIPPFEETQNYVKKIMGYLKEGVGKVDVAVNTDGNKTTADTNTAPVIAPAPIQNNNAFLIANIASSDALEDLDTLFSYEDYLNFVDLFLKNLEEQEKQKEEEEKNTVNNLQDITYNVPVMNLLKNQLL